MLALSSLWNVFNNLFLVTIHQEDVITLFAKQILCGYILIRQICRIGGQICRMTSLPKSFVSISNTYGIELPYNS